MNNRILSVVGTAAMVAVLALGMGCGEAGAGQGNSGAGRADSGEVKVTENIVYGTVNGTDLHLDVYEPSDKATAPRPAVVLIHGGGWTEFDKSTMRAMGQFLARSGFVCFAVDYRLFHGEENRWPAQLDDVQKAVRWVRANADKYAVNPERVGAFGHSAGAQLAALLGMVDTRDNSDATLAKYSSRVQAVVDVSGPTDFTTERDADAVAFLDRFFGSDYAKNAEPWKGASPVYHVGKGDAAFLIVHGTKDDSVPIAQAEELYAKLQAAGVPSAFVKVDDGHTFHEPEARHTLAVETLTFFNRNLVVGR
jgi:acetyl esterase/lipase